MTTPPPSWKGRVQVVPPVPEMGLGAPERDVAPVAQTPPPASPAGPAATPQIAFTFSDSVVDSAAAHGCAPADELTKLRILWGDINPPPRELGLSDRAVDFVMTLLATDAAARPTASGALGHAWMMADDEEK